MVPFSITVLFRLLNFALLIAVCVYIFRRYFLYSIKADMTTREAAQTHLEEHKDVLAHAQSTLDREIGEQEKQQEALKKKIEHWHADFTLMMQNKNQELHVRKQQLIERMEKREHYYAVERAQRAVIPQAVAQARNILQNAHAQTEQEGRYLQPIITWMNKHARS